LALQHHSNYNTLASDGSITAPPTIPFQQDIDMTETTVLISAITAVIVITALALYALRLNSQLSAQTLAAQKSINDKKEQQSDTLNSIKLIAIGAINGELNLSEACIRTAALTDSLFLTDQQKKTYERIYKLANATYSIPRNQAWKDLPKLQRQQLRDQMEQLEADAKGEILSEYKTIVKKIAEGSFIYQA
jgi:hypothetical protein